jgi:hypothetical protein
MGSQDSRPEVSRMGRRAALRRMGGVALGLCTSGCSREFILRSIYPESGALDVGVVTGYLAAFVEAVVPGVQAPARVAFLMQDPGLPFAPFSSVLAADLARRARGGGSVIDFARLTHAQRTTIVAEALSGGGIPARIYNGAVLFAQAAVHGGLGSDDGSCAITGFEGPFRFRGFAEQTYPDPEQFLPVPASADGNPW